MTITKEEIRTKNKTKQDVKPTLTATNIKQLKMLAKKMDIDNYEGLAIFTNRQIIDAINKNYPNIGTREQIAYSIKKMQLINHWTETRQQTGKQRDVKFWTEKSSGLSAELEKIEEQQEKTNQEIHNWKSQSDIIKIRDEVEKQIDQQKNPIKRHTLQNRYILLSMLTMQPPLRKDFYETCNIIKSKKENNDIDNYLVLSNKGKKKTAMYIVNNDKVTERHSKFKLTEYKEIEIDNDELIDLLHEDYTNRPRKYLFETHDNKRYKNITETLLHKPFKLNFDICRSSFITYFYKKYPYKRERIYLAQKMRHDMDTAYTKYNKRTTISSFKDDIIIKSIFNKISKEEREYLLTLL